MSGAMWRSKLGNAFPRAEVEKLDAEHHRMLKTLRSQPGNSQCAECGTQDTTWASVNLGVFLCVRCADVHRALGTHISKVKGCGGTYLWGTDEIAQMKSLGNLAWSSDEPCISASTTKEELLWICRKKYENKPLPLPAPKNTMAAAPRTYGDGSKEAVSPPATKKAGAMKLPRHYNTGEGCTGTLNVSSKSTSDHLLDLDGFWEDCLKPSEPASNASSSEPLISLETSNGASCQLNDLDRCFVPAPPGQSIVCRTISGIDFDAFFNDYSPSGNEKAPSADAIKKQDAPAIHSASVDQGLLKSNSAAPQSSQEGFSGMDFNSNAFFDDFLSGAHGYSGAASKKAAVAW